MESEIQYWHDGSGDMVSLKEICNHIKYNEIIFIGTDSQPRTIASTFVTTVCVRNSEFGVRYYWKREKTNIPGTSISRRILKEVNDSINIGLAIRKIINLKIEIHADINSNPRYASEPFNKTARSMVEGCGFVYQCKPYAWAASSVADWYTK